MRNTLVVKLSIILSALFMISGCSTTMNAIDSRNLTTSVKMSDTIFLEPVAADRQTVWLRIRNTSDKQGLDADTIKATIERKIIAKGYKILSDPNKAQFRLEANILFADLASDSLTAQAAIVGGFGGAFSSASWGNMDRHMAGGLIGAAAGAAIGSMFKINNFLIVIDIQASEQVEGGVKTRISGQGVSGGQPNSMVLPRFHGYSVKSGLMNITTV